MALIPAEGMLPCGELGIEEMGNDDGRRYFTFECCLYVWTKKGQCSDQTPCAVKLLLEG